MEQLDEEKPNVKVHKECRRDFTNPLRKPDLSMGLNNERQLFSATLCSAGKKCFDWKSNCFLCGKSLTVEKKQPDNNFSSWRNQIHGYYKKQNIRWR